MIDQPGLQESQLSEWERLVAEEIQGAGSVVHYWNGAKVQVLLAEIRFLQTFSAAISRDLDAANKTLDEVRNLEWGNDGQECRFCFGIPPEEDPEDGHASNCPLAAALAPAAEVPT